MIGALSLAALAIALLAAGTPRQAEALFRGRLRKPARRACRGGGVALLAASLCGSLDGDDRARHLVAWTGAIGIETLVIALLITLATARSPSA